MNAVRLSQAARAANMLRSAGERIDSADPDETVSERAARLRGAAILALSAALEIAIAAGALEAEAES